MKKILITLSLFMTITAQASIEHSANSSGKATKEEIAASRACFEEVKVQGCGDPGDDIQHFRSCLKNSYEHLSSSCKKMMIELYGTR